MLNAIEGIFKKISELSDYSRALVTLATAIGAFVSLIFVIRITYQLIQVLRLYVCSQYCCQKDLVMKYGKWAVISGSTDGIGRSMAKELAKRGMSIIVIGRYEDELVTTKAMLEQIPNVGDVETVKIDLSDSSPANFDKIREQINPDNRDIGILINNAGIFPPKLTRFNEYDMEFLISIVNVNVMAYIHLTRMIMPGMIKRRKGLVLNVSSLVGCIPGPYLSVYAPTKAFVDSFTRQLQMEYASHPLDIVLITPGPVHTNIIKMHETSHESRPSLTTPTPDDFARSTINGLSAGISIYSGKMLHGLMRETSKFIDSLNMLSFAYRLNRMQSTGRYDL